MCITAGRLDAGGTILRVAGLVHVVGERIDEHHQVGRFELQRMEIAAHHAVAIDHMRHNAVGVFAVIRAREFVSETLGEPAGCVLRLAGTCREEGPIAGFEAMSRAISFEDI